MSALLYPTGLRIEGRAAVVVGGGDVAARRASGLVSAGAIVTLVAPALSVAASALVSTGAVSWRSREYRTGDLDGAWFAHTATGVRAVDDLVAADAETARIWCVRAGDPTASRAWTPAIARHDDVTVAVSAGGDPRRAMAVRDAVLSQLRSGSLPTARVRSVSVDAPVALVGAGPGDPGLLSVRGRELIDAATVIVADRLGARAVLDAVSPSATVIDVGKFPGHHPVPQSEINELLVSLAREGHRVVRLKGGDPYVLGRGGEELIHLREAGIEVDVVSGISSAISVPAAAGIPVTHRGVATGFTVVTGHEALASLPGGRDHTVVLLMGVSTLAATAAALGAGERGLDCPVAIIENGYGADQRVTVGTLASISARATSRGVQSPAIIVVGDVVALSPHWAPLAAATASR